jgi:predicted AlkP superfamily pyrophosphatase or phosphodiesterase
MPQLRPSPAALAALLSALVLSALAPPLVQAADGPPRLVIFISIDQMRGDYITTYGSQWTRGLKRLADDGALFMEGAYPYAYTVTCAGHATMSTGAFPMTHGMIANEWYDRQQGKRVACTDDPTVTNLSYGQPVKGVGNSAAPLLAPTFSDELRAGAPRTPQIVSLSMKPRSAIDLAGHRGDIVVWYSPASGWITSTAFGEQKHPLIEKFIAANPMEREFTKTWTKMLPEKSYLYADDGLAEFPFKGWTNQFPHPITVDAEDTQKSERWEITPFADLYLAKMGIAALQELKLGQTPGTDYLAISFSGLDRVGHGFGPRSHEVQDLLANLDQTIGLLLDAVDARVGKGNYVVALTGDHGASPVPEQLVAMGFDAGRYSVAPAVKKIEDLLVKKFGGLKDNGKYIVDQTAGYLYFAPGVYDKLRADPETMKAAIDVLLQTPGIAQVVRREQLESTLPTDDAFVRAARLSFRPERSGDLFVVPKRYWQSGAQGTTHGTPYKYDQRVPVLLYGAGVKAGQYWGPASPADLAPTLAAICRVTMSRPDGRVLSEALDTNAGYGTAATSARPAKARPASQGTH